MDENERTLWCGNLSEKVTEAILYELFLQGGPLEKVLIPKDKSGNQRRFGFVVYKHPCSVPYAAALFEGTALYRKVIVLQHRQSVGGDAPHSSNLTVHQRALSCPVNFNAPPIPMMQLNSQTSLPGVYPDVNGVQQLLNLYQNQLMSIPNPVGALAKSSLMGTWNRNRPYPGTPRLDREHDRRRSSGYNRMEPDTNKKSDHHARKYHHRRDYH